MKHTMLRSLMLLAVSLGMTLSVAAQDEPKVKTSDKETKYKSDELKIKDKKDEQKYKTDDGKIKDKKDEEKYKVGGLKMKDKKDEQKYKGETVKIKDKKDERKIKGKVKPMQPTSYTRTEMKTGETQVQTREYVKHITAEPPEPTPAVVVQQPVAVVPVVKKHVHRYAKRPVAASNVTPARKYIVRTKIVRDTVFVPSQPERIVSVDTEYVHDTVSMTRVDTVMSVQTSNTYTGYAVPRSDFKKVKLKKDKDNGDVWMKRKEKNGKTKTAKIQQE